MDYCQWEAIEGKAWKCANCGRRWSGSKPKQVACTAKLSAEQQRAMAAQQAFMPTGNCCGGGMQVLPPPAPPGIIKRMINFARTAVDFVQDGMALADHGLQGVRAATCNRCAVRSGDWCNGCGCYLPIARQIRAKHCPLGLWPGDSENWVPSVNDDWLRKVLVIVPTTRGPWLTDCLADIEREPVDIQVIDGGGSWLEKCNTGLKWFLDGDHQWVVLLNDDVRLSKGFFAGLLIAYMQTGADSISACYNVGHAPQLPTHQVQPLADEYKPRPVHRQVGITDGTCVMFTRRAIETCGTLDGEQFGQYGWGAVDDLQIRMKQQGMGVFVTEAAYVHHLEAKTAEQVFGSREEYVARARQAVNLGMKAKWGDDWGTMAAEWNLRHDAGPTIKTRNLVYHCYPDGNWRWNLERLFDKLHIFNGKRVACVVSGVNSDNMLGAIRELTGHGFHLVVKPNDRKLCDSVAFLEMLGVVQSADAEEATLFAHTKGATSGQQNWGELMYSWCLDHADEMLDGLRTHPVAGTRKCVVANPQHFPYNSAWHYSGSFCWYRHDALFSRDWNARPPVNRYFVECYPSLFFSADEAFNMGPTC
jgi:hypothetical protein